MEASLILAHSLRRNLTPQADWEPAPINPEDDRRAVRGYLSTLEDAAFLCCKLGLAKFYIALQRYIRCSLSPFKKDDSTRKVKLSEAFAIKPTPYGQG